MSETKIRLCLKYNDGRYLSWKSSNFPLTHKLSEARRFYSTEQIADFLTNSYYRPEQYGLDAAEFEITEITITYEEVIPSERDKEPVPKD
jgi:hypothetical protein